MTKDDESGTADGLGEDDRGHLDSAAPAAEEALDATKLVDGPSEAEPFGGTQLIGEVTEATGMDGTVLLAQPELAEETPAEAVAVEPYDEVDDMASTPPSGVVALSDDVVALVPAPLEELEPEHLEELEPEDEEEEDQRPTLIQVTEQDRAKPAPTSATAPDLPEGETIEQAAETSVRTVGTFGPLPFGVPTKGPDPDATAVAGPAPVAEPPSPPAVRPKAPMPNWVKVLAMLALAGGPLGYAAVRGLRTKKAPAPPAPTQAAVAKPSARKPAPAKRPKPPAPPPQPTAPSTASAASPEPPSAPVRAADLSRCVAAVFAQDDEPGPLPDLELVCRETDAREVVKKMSVVMVTGTGIGAAAKREWVKLGWYRMARMQVARTKCCGDVPPLTSIAALSACGLDDALAAFAAAGGDQAGISAAATDYDKAVSCLFKAQASRLFSQRRRPSAFERGVFRDSLGQD